MERATESNGARSPWEQEITPLPPHFWQRLLTAVVFVLVLGCIG